MRTIIVLAVGLLSASGLAQTTKLGAATFAAERATIAEWNEAATCVAYGWGEQEGSIQEVGVYNLLTKKGKVLFKPAEGEQIEHQLWLAGRPVRILSTTQNLANRPKPTILRSIWALDAVTLEARKIWSQEFEVDSESTLEIEPSPSIPHAVVSLYSKAGAQIYAITLGATGIVFSQDASKAVAAGNSLSGWSVDGTAIFGPNTSATAFFLNRKALALDKNLDATQTVGLAITLEATKADLRGDLKSSVPLRIRLDDFSAKFVMRPAYEAGASVLEMMPGNGALRPIKFHGYWEGAETPATVQLVSQAEPLKFQQTTDQTNSLWIAPATEDAKKGVLVSPSAEMYWLAPKEKAIAFTIHGVLFVRTIIK